MSKTENERIDQSELIDKTGSIRIKINWTNQNWEKIDQSDLREIGPVTMVEIKVCQMLKMQNSNYGFTVETKKVKNLTMPFVQKLVRKSFPENHDILYDSRVEHPAVSSSKK